VQGQAAFAEFDLPKISVRQEAQFDPQALVDALLISPADLGFENHKVSLWNAGVPFLMTPVRDIAAVRSIRFDAQRWRQSFAPGAVVPDLYVYCRGGVDHRASFHARMFAPDMGISEDPATGGAVAAMSGAIQLFDAITEGHHALLIEQGVEMGRASHIHLHIETRAGKISSARIGGQAVKVAQGELYL
jgi:trans-2,3-dihydro-3-hydroxyanthranilate isomerase